MEYDELQVLIDELKEYIQYEGAELGEACDYLISIANYEGYIGDRFYVHVCDELQAQLNNFKANTKWVETEEEISRTVITKDLWWKGSDY